MDGMHLRAVSLMVGDTERPKGSVARGHSARIDRRALLSCVIERDIIPELLCEMSLRRLSGAGQSIANYEVETAELTAIALGSSASAVTEYVAALHARGRSAESLCLDLLTPVARRLGDGWVDDTCDFTDVTIGVWRLLDAMRFLCPPVVGGPSRRNALLTPMPGEQHSFGLAMVSEFFRRADWDAWSGETGTASELIAIVRARHLDLVGFSLSSDEFLEPARLLIAQVRTHSANPDLVVMVGGSPFLSSPELAHEIGADATAADATEAVARADELVAVRYCRYPAVA